KKQWALEHHKQNTDTPPASDLQPYLGFGPDRELPYCPADSTATFAASDAIGSVGENPACRLVPATHVLPRYPWLYNALHYRRLGDVITRVMASGVVLWVVQRWRRSQKRNAVSV